MYGYYPDQKDKITVSKAIITLFPCYETPSSKCDGIVSFTISKMMFFFHSNSYFHWLFYWQDLIFNPSTSTGWLVSILKTRRTQNKATKPTQKRTTMSRKRQAIDSIECLLEYTQENGDDDIRYLKQTPYTDDTEDEIKARLKRSAEFRRAMLEDLSSNIISNFPYLFVHSELVLLKMMRIIIDCVLIKWISFFFIDFIWFHLYGECWITGWFFEWVALYKRAVA